jgi:hypothetical protein
VSFVDKRRFLRSRLALMIDPPILLFGVLLIVKQLLRLAETNA